jgi:hypothetical protein
MGRMSRAIDARRRPIGLRSAEDFGPVLRSKTNRQPVAHPALPPIAGLSPTGC